MRKAYTMAKILQQYAITDDTQDVQAIQGITTLQAIDVMLEMFDIKKELLLHDELESLQFDIEAKTSIYTGTRYSCFNKTRNKTVDHMSISDVVTDLVAMSLVAWFGSDLSYVKDAPSCKIEICFNSCISSLTGEVWKIEEWYMEDNSLYFNFNRESANEYLRRHITSVRDESNENHSYLVFENDTVLGMDCLIYKIVQGEFEYTI